MDRNSIIGLVLIVGILMTWSLMFKPSKKQEEALLRRRDSIENVQRLEQAKQQLRTQDSLKNKVAGPSSDSATNKALQEKLGSFASAAKDSNEFITIENNLVKIKLSAKGGRPYSAELKKYTRYDSLPVVLFNGDSTKFGLNFFSQNNRQISTNDLFFKPLKSSKQIVVKNTPDSVTLRLYAKESSYIEYIYTMKPNDYMIKFRINFVNMDSIIAKNNNSLDLTWAMYVPRQEKGSKNENTYTYIQYKHFQDDDESLSPSKDVKKDIATQLKWIAFKQQFFSSVIVAGESFNNATLESNEMLDMNKYLKRYSTTISINYQSAPTYSIPLSFYFGPNQYKTLKQYNVGLEKLVFLGSNIVLWINKFVILPIFNWLNGFISNYGLIILLLTLIIKIALFPLTYKSYQSQAKMRVLKPQIDEINKKIPKDKAMERQQATMALYKKAGVNPLGGCLPMLLQFPILFAMFRLFPTSIELRHEHFLWATDLSTYDSILQLPFTIPFYGDHVSLFTILMTVSTIISMKMSQGTTSEFQMPGMKNMMYIMPVMFMFVLNSFSAGLTYYYFLANVITIGQNELFKRMINEEKLLKKIHANKAKVVKKSKFQERLEKMAKDRGYKGLKK
jgi:YidC/Oxa1 family membrane protein insertase